MEKITTHELFKAFKKNLSLIISMTLIFGVLGVIYGKFIKSEMYTAETVMIIVGNEDEKISYNKLLLNEKLSNIYSEILTSEDIYIDAIEENNLEDTEPNELEAALTTDVNTQAGIITFELVAENPDRAEDELIAVCEKFKDYVKKYLNTDNLEYLQDVSVKNDSKTNNIKYGGLGLVLGFFFSLLFIAIREVTSNKIKDDLYLRDIGIDVLGVIDDKE